MYNNQTKINLPIIIFSFIETIVIVVLITLFYKLFTQPDPIAKITIDNVSSVPNLPESYKEDIYAKLYDIAASNTNPTTKIPNNGATIRSDSIFENKDKKYGNFIVDIESIQQSYYIQYDYSKNDKGYPFSVSCPSNNQKAYKTQKCNAGSENQLLSDLLPYYSNVESNQYFTIAKNTYFSPANPNIIIISSICDNYDHLSSKIDAAAKQWLSDNNIENYTLSKDYSCFNQF